MRGSCAGVDNRLLRCNRGGKGPQTEKRQGTAVFVQRRPRHNSGKIWLGRYAAVRLGVLPAVGAGRFSGAEGQPSGTAVERRTCHAGLVYVPALPLDPGEIDLSELP